ncbi:hypothetical protein [Brenneria alni]|uniref:hypothetical protein n=1 Tax=Brenneria alni TaxID=71656 RepID=UPI001474E217|nr:hypothetical protein [Brenneria alni]
MCRTHEKGSKTYFIPGGNFLDNEKITVFFHKIKSIFNSETSLEDPGVIIIAPMLAKDRAMLILSTDDEVTSDKKQAKTAKPSLVKAVNQTSNSSLCRLSKKSVDKLV